MRPGALAYALPYDGTHVHLFCDRVAAHTHPALLRSLLAHVLVHEITHILEGIDRHSDRGIIKARWDEQDLFSMARKPLKFEREDIDLICRGLPARTERAAAAAKLAAVAIREKPAVRH